LAVHGAAGVYLYTMTFKPMQIASTEDSPPVVFRTIRLYKDEVQPAPNPSNPIRTHTPTQTPYMPEASDIALTEPLEPAIILTDRPDFSTAVVQEPPLPPAKVIGRPSWIAKPNAAQLADAYPRRAQTFGLSGTATLICTVNAVGTVRECAVAGEAPADAGFGTAALKLSRHFRMKAQTEDGQPVGGAQVTIPLKFTLGD